MSDIQWLVPPGRLIGLRVADKNAMSASDGTAPPSALAPALEEWQTDYRTAIPELQSLAA